MARRPRRHATAYVLVAAGGLAAAALALLGGYYVKDAVDHGPATAAAQRKWTAARPAIAARLKQGSLEFGAVWATHTGVICGMVNGRGSFGGLTGMTPFYVGAGAPVYALDETAEAFAPGWSHCMRDSWITILPGSKSAGYCATKAGAKSCGIEG